MRRRFALILVAAMAFIAPQVLTGQQPATPTEAQVERLLQRMLGTWRLNVAKSQYLVDAPPQQSFVTYGPAKEKWGITYSRRRVEADGSQVNLPGLDVQVLDGKERAYTSPSLAIVRRPIDEFTAEALHYVKDPSIPPGFGFYGRSRQVFAPDGKTMTITTSYAAREGGEKVIRIGVWDKVAP